MGVGVCVCAHVFVRVCVCGYTCVWVCECVCKCVCASMCERMCVCERVRVRAQFLIKRARRKCQVKQPQSAVVPDLPMFE